MYTNELIKKYRLDKAEEAQFIDYISNKYSGCIENTSPDISYIKPWVKLTELSNSIGADKLINRMLCPERPVDLIAPDKVRLEIYDSFAGPVPIIYADDPLDFEALVTNIVHKGKRPEDISKTGASFVFGKKTSFLILSSKPYSNVPAKELGIDENIWPEKSLVLRRSHECTHYFTKQIYGISNNNLHDELMADLIGIYDAFGFYRAEWFLRFMGIIEGSGKRIDVYTGNLSEKVRAALKEMIIKAAQDIEMWTRSDEFKAMPTTERIKQMCKNGLVYE